MGSLFAAASAPMLAALFGSIPSPSSSQIELGPLRLTAYGLMIAIGVVASVEIARRRHAARGGDPEDISQLGLWGVLAGMVGARLYHVATDYDRFQGNWGDAVKIWEGGLGIPGGLVAGVAAGLLVARRRGMTAPYALDIVAPAIPVAQAIGRWGNWFNQELFGGPSNLPWALRIDAQHRPVGYETQETYHPTFLYESLWNLALAGFIIAVERRSKGRLRPGSLFAIYVAGYGIGRFWVESLRIDPAREVFGVRFNLLLAAVVAGLALLWLALRARRLPAVATGDAGTGPALDDAGRDNGVGIDDGAGNGVGDGIGVDGGGGGEGLARAGAEPAHKLGGGAVLTTAESDETGPALHGQSPPGRDEDPADHAGLGDQGDERGTQESPVGREPRID